MERHEPVARRFSFRPDVEVPSPAPQGFSFVVEERPGAGSGEDRMVHEDDESASRLDHPPDLGEEPVQVGNQVEDEDGERGGKGIRSSPFEAGKPASHNRTCLAGPRQQAPRKVATHDVAAVETHSLTFAAADVEDRAVDLTQQAEHEWVDVIGVHRIGVDLVHPPRGEIVPIGPAGVTHPDSTSRRNLPV